MSNIVYADPFGSYVKGQQEGTQNTIAVGEAARRFRSEDLNNEFMKWYMPHRQEQAQIEIQKQKLGVDIERGQMLANLAASGDPHAQLLLQQHLQQMTGQTFDWGGKTPQETAWIGLQMMNALPGASGFLNPNVTSAGPHGMGRYVAGPGNPFAMHPGETPEDFEKRAMSYSPWLQKYAYGIDPGQQGVGGGQRMPPDIANGWLEDAPAQSGESEQPQDRDIFSVPAQTFPKFSPEGGIYRPGNVMDNNAFRNIEAGGMSQYGKAPTERGVEEEQGSGAVETYGGSGTIEHSYPPMATKMPTMTVRPPTNAPTAQDSIWHDERERVRGPVRQMGNI